jgi:DNA-directed RNA polymerase specialized sigma24 family protein
MPQDEFQGLPTTFVGGRKIVGARGEEVYRDAFERAARGDANRGVPAWLFSVMVAACAAVVVWLGRKRRVASGAQDAAVG